MAMNIRLSEEQDRQLRDLAEAEQRSMNDIIGLAIAERWQRRIRGQRITAMFDEVAREDSELLDRLGK